MAIAGIVVSVLQSRLDEVRAALLAHPGIVDVQNVEDTRLAAVLESPSESLPSQLEVLNKLEFVLGLDVAYVNYEEDMAPDGHIPCPPHRPKERQARESEDS